MIQIKKTILTLVALLAVTTGAWADVTWSLSGSTLTISGTGAMADYLDFYGTPWYDNSEEIKTIVIESGVTSIGNNAFGSCTYLEFVSIPASVTSICFSAFKNCGSDATALTVSFAEGSTPLTISAGAFENANLKSIDIPNRVTSIGGYAFTGCNNLELVSIPASVTSIGEEAFSYCGKLANVSIYAPSLTTYGANAFAGNAAGRKIYVLSDAVDTYKAGWSAYAADIEAIPGSAPSGPEVAWNKAEKTGSFTMPGGNVTLEPEYYPQAAVADGGVTAADADARATTDDPLVKVDATKLTGAKKLMYFVSNSGTTAPAYDAEGWTDQLPTAEGFTQQGIVYVWYYPVGTDEGVDGATATYSDGDICLQSITARIAAEPTYAVTFADDTAEPTLWKANPATDVKKGETVTVTYTGQRKVMGVKAEKKAAAAAAKDATAEDLGKLIGADGNIYDTKAAAEAANTTAVAMIAYVGSSTDNATYTHGLAIALADEEGQMNWNPAKSTCEGKSAVTNAAWQLPSQNQWKAMFKAFGDNDASYSGLNTAITNAGGTALMGGNYYWSTTPDEGHVFCVSIDNGNDIWQYGYVDEDSYCVRACLAF